MQLLKQSIKQSMTSTTRNNWDREECITIYRDIFYKKMADMVTNLNNQIYICHNDKCCLTLRSVLAKIQGLQGF